MVLECVGRVLDTDPTAPGAVSLVEVSAGPSDIVVANVTFTQVEFTATPSVLAYQLHDQVKAGTGTLFSGAVTDASLPSYAVVITGDSLPTAELFPLDDALEVQFGITELNMTFNENMQASTGSLSIVDDSLIGPNEVVSQMRL